MSEQPRPALPPDVEHMRQMLLTIGRLVFHGHVSAIAIAVTTTTGPIVGHHVVPGNDPHVPYALRGLIAELDDQVRDAYCKGDADKPPIFSPDGTPLG